MPLAHAQLTRSLSMKKRHVSTHLLICRTPISPQLVFFSIAMACQTLKFSRKIGGTELNDTCMKQKMLLPKHDEDNTLIYSHSGS